MLPYIEIIQQSIYSLAISLLIVYISSLPKRSLFFSSLFFVLLLVGSNLIPLYHGSSLVELLRGAIGDVSTASGVLMLFIILNQFNFTEVKFTVLNSWEKIGLGLLGTLLYLSTFGFINFDLYHLGYLSPLMLLFFSAVILFLILFNRILGYVWLFALIGFYFKLQSSNNLWDYLYDPLLWLVLLTNGVSSMLSLQLRRKVVTIE
ncbi:MAG: hypothetical protein K2Y14_13350 [Burkholderiales bacterium]|nr:hypothetical protein [Burkholderiales bacterium]